MNIERLFKVLVVTGVSSGGLFGCGGDSGADMPSGTGGKGSGGASHGDGGAKGDGASQGSGGASTGATGSGGATGTGGSGAMCDCKPSAAVASWTDCNGCCCWLPVGLTTKT